MLLDETAARITAEGLLAAGYVLLQGALTPTPDKQVVLHETGGLAAARFFCGSATVDQPGLQLVVRGPARDYAGPRAQIETLYQALCDWGAFEASGVRYLGLSPQQAPFPMTRDENERVVFAVNFLVQKEWSAA